MSQPLRTTDTSPRHVRCCVIAVTYNSAAHIERFLDSLAAAADGLTLRCIVVDNQSVDETPELVAPRPEVELIEAGANLGYSGAINLARRHVGPSDSILIVNPDLMLLPGCIKVLMNALEDPSIGVAVPRLLDHLGKTLATLRREPSILGSLGEAVFGDRWASRPAWCSETLRRTKGYEATQDVDWASGAALCVSRACDAAVGDWDDKRFFLYSEETDFARRARSHGFRIRYTPDAQAAHDEGGSGRNAALDALGSVNRVRYYEKYHGRPATATYRATIALKHLLRIWDPDDLYALRHLCRRSTWRELPGGREG